ncbi:DUF6584 family protein [Flavobacterium litorale]|uniref:Uncharacterized protein n=1 Tax=Flavobacterium litorale TaxID=2856519 RepID=A0ABX8VBZ2_9FLAO|nr:DUF6584 family protein [Flavobacterium litorale]QYJ68335.1 hypothetical protein K1I41_00140 [Flavobacterium litorale]
MYLNIQLKKAQLEIDSGLKERAANRLKNFLNAYPDAMEAREMLALLYYESGFLDMAGKYWFLTEPTHDYMLQSIKVYQKSVGYSPIQILKDLKYRGDKSGLPDYAREKLIALEVEVKAMGHAVPYKPKNAKKPINYKASFKEKVFNGCFFVVSFLCIMFLIIGVIESITWVVHLF